MIQKQTWKDEIRILITDEENLGSVQISIPLYVSDVLKAITDYKPIFGHRTTIKNQTIWMAFMK